MNTLSKGFLKRALSALLATIMVFSLGVVGITSISAAETELAETGWDSNSTLYCLNSITYDGWNPGSHVKMSWQSGGFHQFAFNDITTNKDLYFKVHASNGEKMGASGNDLYIKPNYGSDTALDTYWGYDCNWKIWLGDYSQYDTVDVYIKVYTQYSGKDNVVVVNIQDGKTSAKDYYLPGSFNDWTASDNKFVADGSLLSTTVELTAGTTYTFKVYDSKDTWYGASATLKPTINTPASTTVSRSNGDNVNLTIAASSSGEYKFTLDPSTMTVTVSFVKAAFDLVVNAEALESEVFAGTNIEITSSTNATTGTTVTYTLKNSAGTQVGSSNTDGIFVIDTADFEAGEYKYTVTASATVNGASYTDTSDVITVKVNRFDGLLIYPKAPSSVEAGTNINITVTANTSTEVTYTLTDGDGVEITNTTGIFSVTTSPEDINTTKTFTIGASTVVNSTTYTSEAVNIAVKVDPISNTTEVNLYFKATSTKGYVPYATVTGLYESFSEVEMEKAFYIGSNATNSADYWWYKISTKVSDAMPKISFSVVLGRYAFEDEITLTVVDGVTDYYFAIDNLYYDNDKNDMINVTDWNEIERDYCESAVHMVYDPQYDTQTELDTFAQNRLMLANGDVNMDDSVNVKDTTLLQKDLADLAELGTVGEKVADFDCDGVSTIKDATAIQKAVVGL